MLQENQPHPDAPDGGRMYGKFQNEIYARGMFKNIPPTVTTDPNKLEAQAKTHLGVQSFNYVSGGAGERATMDANRLAFRQWKVFSKALLRSCNHQNQGI